MGFQGMRGKKYWYDDDYYSDKRAPMGFQGMRGKKSSYDEDYYDDQEKRAPMGFQGMRGKKSLEEVSSSISIPPPRPPKAEKLINARAHYVMCLGAELIIFFF